MIHFFIDIRWVVGRSLVFDGTRRISNDREHEIIVDRSDCNDVKMYVAVGSKSAETLEESSERQLSLHHVVDVLSWLVFPSFRLR